MKTRANPETPPRSASQRVRRGQSRDTAPSRKRLLGLVLVLLVLIGAAVWSWRRMPPSEDRLRAMSPSQLEEYLRGKPTDERAWIARGDLALEDEDPAAAHAAYRAALKIDPNSVRAGAGVGLTMALTGNVFHGEALLEQLRREAPEAAAPVAGLARLHLRAGNPNLANRLLIRSTELEPNNPEHWYQLALLAGALNQYVTAEDAFKRAQTLAPQVGRYYRAHADLLVFLNKREQGLVLVRRAMKLAPWDTRAQFVYGKLLLLDPSPIAQQEGEAALREALRRVPGWLHPRLELARRALQRGEVKEALTELERLDRDFPDNQEIRYQLAQAYLRSGEMAKGEQVLSSYQKRLAEGNRYKEDELRSFTRPDDAELHLRVARYCMKRGVALGAAMHYREVLRLRPDHPEAKRALEELGTGGGDAAL